MTNRANARAREIAVKDRMPALLAVMLVLMFGVALWALFGVEIPEGNKAVIYSMIGSLGTPDNHGMCILSRVK